MRKLTASEVKIIGVIIEEVGAAEVLRCITRIIGLEDSCPRDVKKAAKEMILLIDNNLNEDEKKLMKLMRERKWTPRAVQVDKDVARSLQRKGLIHLLPDEYGVMVYKLAESCS